MNLPFWAMVFISVLFCVITFLPFFLLVRKARKSLNMYQKRDALRFEKEMELKQAQIDYYKTHSEKDTF